MRNGEKFLSCGVPIDRRTLAPTPSDCSTARNALRIALETVIFAVFGMPYIDFNGNKGSPLNTVVLGFLNRSCIVSRFKRSVSLNAIARIAMVIEEKRKRTFMEIEASFIVITLGANELSFKEWKGMERIFVRMAQP
jgi:hypothetical protein